VKKHEKQLRSLTLALAAFIVGLTVFFYAVAALFILLSFE
jgi:preprotein translocase subunit SecE